MNYRDLGNTGLKVSEIGMGCEGFGENECRNTQVLFDLAEKSGINYFDLYTSNPKVRASVGDALNGRREKFIIQSHICSIWKDGQYERSRNIDEVKASFEEMLSLLQTDYIDVYQFHNPAFCPKPGDESGLYDAALKAKEQGKIKHIGITNHRLSVANEAIESGLYETLQFPFCYLATEKDIELVEKCREADMGFIAMKAMGGGLITRADASYAFCAQYENVLPIWGVQRERELDEFLSYQENEPVLDNSLESIIKKDLSELQGDFCRGCGYCMPCPAGIEINNCARMSLMIRRAPSDAQLTDEMQAKMKKIDECLHCGKCKEKCPYGLDTPALLKKNYEDYMEILAGKEY